MTGSRRVRRATDRFVTRRPGIETRHCFSFGEHYDPEHVSHGRLLVHDEHRLDAGAGFGPHPHRDVEVVSWVLDGALVHEGPGGTAVLPAGGVQRMTAGSGVVHAERAAAGPTRFVQLWLAAEAGLAPSYEQVVVPAADVPVEVLPGIHVGRLAGRWTVPAAPRTHVYVARGSCTLDDVTLDEGDSVRLTETADAVLEAAAQAELVVVA